MFRPAGLQLILGSAGMGAAKEGDTTLMVVVLIGMFGIAFVDLFWGPTEYKSKGRK